MTDVIQHELTQGSPEWLAYRTTMYNASDAPVMMSESGYRSRGDLLREHATGVTREVDAATQNIFDDGHSFEALARPLAEAMIDELLYAKVLSIGKISASFDGLTDTRDIGWEHKTMNNVLREAFARIRAAGDSSDPTFNGGALLPRAYQIQMAQQMLVSGAERVLFMASKWDLLDPVWDEAKQIWEPRGNLIEEAHCWFHRDRGLEEEIRRGWDQFERDLLEWKPPIDAPEATADPISALPALAVQLEGRVLASNLPAFKTTVEHFVATIKTDLETDQDFANAKALVKFCGEAEKRIDAALENALGQTTTISELVKTLEYLRDDVLAAKRIQLNKLVKAREAEIKERAIAAGIAELREHANALNAECPKPWIPQPLPATVQEAAKGKRTIATLREAIDGAVAKGKIEQNARAMRMHANWDALDDVGRSLFPDFVVVGDKPAEDFQALALLRRKEHDEAQARAEAERQAREAAEAERAKRAAEDAERRRMEREVAERNKPTLTAQPETADAWTTNAAVVDTVASARANRNATTAAPPTAQAQSAANDEETTPTLSVGDINRMLAPLSISGAGMEELGIVGKKDGRSTLFSRRQFRFLLAAIAVHVQGLADEERILEAA